MRIVTDSDPVIVHNSGPGRASLESFDSDRAALRLCADEAHRAYLDEVDRQEAAGVWDPGKLNALYGAYQRLEQMYQRQ